MISSTLGGRPADPSTDGSEHFRHYAPSKVVTLAYVAGIEIVGLCGTPIVAHRDYETFPDCSAWVDSSVFHGTTLRQ